jgi:GT2 family glycosyltransferase
MKAIEDNTMKIAVLIATFNRANVTLNCLDNLYKSQSSESTFDVYLVDGGSSDGTAQLVNQTYPEVKVSVENDVYWNLGMLKAWEKALESLETYDGFLWLNDDVQLKQGSLQEIFQAFEDCGRKSIIVGHTISPGTNEITYGPLKRSGKSKINFEPTCSKTDKIVTMNGNCVLIPYQAQELIGLLNPRFQHSFGDIDYGLRATKAGINIMPINNAVSELERNNSIYSRNRKITLIELLYLMRDPKGIPVLEWFYFTRVHAGIFWPFNFILRYLKLLR